jgi:arylsulfatase A-like enzyme
MVRWIQQTWRFFVAVPTAVAGVMISAPLVHLAQAADASPPTRINVVVLLADDLGYGDPSCHGGSVPTPHIDRLMSQGVELQTLLVQPVCSPTRAAFFTGRDPARVGVNPQVINARNGEMMNPKETTLAEVFKSAGYSTALMGKWHLGYAPSSPNHKGFDLFYGFLGAATDYLNRTDDPHTQWMLNDKPSPDPGYSTELIRDRSIEFIGENAERPFFLHVAFNAVHNPVQATPQYLARVPAAITDEHARARAGMLLALDDAVGAIVKKIDDQGLAARTIIVFFSDNGPTPDGSAGPLKGRKHSLYDGGVRSAAVVRWSGTLQAGKRTNAMLAAEDLFPTLLKLTGTLAPQGVALDGKDFSACLTGDAPSPREQRCWLWIDCDSIRTARYKLIRFADHRELYDLQNDAAESRNIVRERAEVAADLERRLNEWQASVPIYPSHVALQGDGALAAKPAGDVLEVRAVRDKKEPGAPPQPLGILLGQCERFAIGSGDRLEYDLLVAPDSASQGVRISINPPVTKKKAQRSRAIDADEEGAGGDDGAGAAAGGDAARRWSRRSFGLANYGGKMLNSVWLTVDARQPAKYLLYLDNVIVRRADGSVVEVYRDGAPAEQRQNREAPGYSQVSVKVVDAAKAQQAQTSR